MSRFWKIAAIVAVVAIVGTAVAVGVAFAQNAPSGSTTGPFDFGQRLREAIASALGITVDKYDAAVTTAEKQVLDQAVAEGWLTQSQADQAQQRLNENPYPGWPGRGFMEGRMGLGCFGQKNGSLIQAAADKLAMTVQDLMTQLNSGKTIADVAKDKGVDTQVIVDAYLAQVKSSLDQAVANGKITQKMADYVLEQAKTNASSQLTATWQNLKHGKFRHGEQPETTPTPSGQGGL